jgi:hypothetical protein
MGLELMPNRSHQERVLTCASPSNLNLVDTGVHQAFIL